METLTTIRKKVYDPILRLIHLAIGLSVLGLILTAAYAYVQIPGPQKTILWILHIKIGYVLISAFSARIVWFILGPCHAKLTALLHPQEWKLFLTTRKLPKFSEKFGHDPFASLSYLVFYGMIIVISVTGLLMAAIDHGKGPFTNLLFDELDLLDLLQTPHLLLSFGIGFFILLHVSAIIHHEKSEHRPISQAMISGYQYRKITTTTITTENTNETTPSK